MHLYIYIYYGCIYLFVYYSPLLLLLLLLLLLRQEDGLELLELYLNKLGDRIRRMCMHMYVYMYI